MAKLKFNDDGTATVPLRPDDQGKAREVVLPEPSMRQLSKITELVNDADKQLPPMDAVSSDASPEQRTQLEEQVRARTLAMFGDMSPHGQAFIAIVNMLTPDGVTYTEDDFAGWVMSPRAAGRLLAHFQSPLLGEDAQDG